MPKKEKKSKRDIGKKELHRLLYDIFSGNPDQSFNYKQLAQRLGIKNMNAKQLIMTVLYEMKNDNKNNPIVNAGIINGRMIYLMSCHEFAPSILAASLTDSGIC